MQNVAYFQFLQNVLQKMIVFLKEIKEATNFLVLRGNLRNHLGLIDDWQGFG